MGLDVEHSTQKRKQPILLDQLLKRFFDNHSEENILEAYDTLHFKIHEQEPRNNP
uniref:Uncharacterized protein n=1 Tax=Arundo donax TaxID=35708 RepID=A0A0A8ZXL7_ARUDO